MTFFVSRNLDHTLVDHFEKRHGAEVQGGRPSRESLTCLRSP